MVRPDDDSPLQRKSILRRLRRMTSRVRNPFEAIRHIIRIYCFYLIALTLLGWLHLPSFDRIFNPSSTSQAASFLLPPLVFSPFILPLLVLLEAVLAFSAESGAWKYVRRDFAKALGTLSLLLVFLYWTSEFSAA